MDMQAEMMPLEFLQLAAHPLRWRLLGELAESDRLVSELTERVGEPQNLVSYHLGKLRDGRLVSARRSSADGRDTYYAADLALFGAQLAAAGGALHPALALALPSREKTRKGPAVKVLFLCTGNSARSQIAEALANARSGGAIKAFSAGSEPRALHTNAVRVMREEYGLDLSEQSPKHLDIYAGQQFDFVITLCDRVREVCPRFPGGPKSIHWSMPNPATGASDRTTYPLFQQTAAELSTRLAFLLAALPERKPRPSKAKVKP